MAPKKGKTANVFPLLFFVVFGSGVRAGMEKSRIRGSGINIPRIRNPAWKPILGYKYTGLMHTSNG
jgi:hypothetical protein